MHTNSNIFASGVSTNSQDYEYYLYLEVSVDANEEYFYNMSIINSLHVSSYFISKFFFSLIFLLM